MKINLPENVSYIIDRLEAAGYEAYAVGGCVRDSVLGRKPKDWDITTSARPEEVKRLFKRTVDTGLQHGTVTVLCRGEIKGFIGYEVTTFRLDGDYADHRRPDKVEYTTELSEDLMRRDFTINAMAYSDKTGIVDIYGGMEDIERGVIRCVGNPDERFSEDALRIMRGVRFAAELGFEIDESTREAMRAHVTELMFVSAERIEVELTKLLVSAHPEEIEEAYRLGITEVILPEFDVMMDTPQNTPYHLYDVGHHTIEVMKAIPQDSANLKVLRYSALLHDTGKPDVKTTDEYGTDHFKGHNVVSEKIADRIMHRLKMDNSTIEQVKRLVYWHDFGLNGDLTKAGFRRGMSKMGIDYFDDLMVLKKADMEGQSDYKIDERMEILESFQEMYDEVMDEKQCLTLRELAIGGTELMSIGVPAGPEMGRILHRLLDAVLERPELNDSKTLLDMAREAIDD